MGGALILLVVCSLPMLGYLSIPPQRRHGIAYALPVLSALLLAAAILFVVAVNLGWVSL